MFPFPGYCDAWLPPRNFFSSLFASRWPVPPLRCALSVSAAGRGGNGFSEPGCCCCWLLLVDIGIALVLGSLVMLTRGFSAAIAVPAVVWLATGFGLGLVVLASL